MKKLLAALLAICIAGPAAAWTHGKPAAKSGYVHNPASIAPGTGFFTNIITEGGCGGSYNPQSNGTGWSYAQISDANGYPSAAPPTGSTAQCSGRLSSDTSYSGAYNMTWTGTLGTGSGGTGTAGANFSTNGFSAVGGCPGTYITTSGCAGGAGNSGLTGLNGTITFTPNVIGTDVQVIPIPNSSVFGGLANLKIYRADQEGADINGDLSDSGDGTGVLHVTSTNSSTLGLAAHQEIIGPIAVSGAVVPGTRIRSQIDSTHWKIIPGQTLAGPVRMKTFPVINPDYANMLAALGPPVRLRTGLGWGLESTSINEPTKQIYYKPPGASGVGGQPIPGLWAGGVGSGTSHNGAIYSGVGENVVCSNTAAGAAVLHINFCGPANTDFPSCPLVAGQMYQGYFIDSVQSSVHGATVSGTTVTFDNNTGVAVGQALIGLTSDGTAPTVIPPTTRIISFASGTTWNINNSISPAFTVDVAHGIYVVPTLNIGCGDNPIGNIFGIGNTTGIIGATGSNDSRSVYQLAWEPTLGVWMPNFLINGAALEWQLELCNTVGTACQPQIPWTFDISPTNIQKMGTVVLNNLDSTNIYAPEFGNEVISGISLGGDWAGQVGQVVGFPTSLSGSNEWSDGIYGLRNRQIMSILKDQFAAVGRSNNFQPYMSTLLTDSNKTVRVLGQDLTLDINGKYTTGIGGAGSGLAIATNYSIAGSCTASNTTSGRPGDCIHSYGMASYFEGANMWAGNQGVGYLLAESAIYNVTNITQANPGCVTTSTASNFSAGDRLTFSGIGGMTQLNNAWITVAASSGGCTLDATHFPISNVMSSTQDITFNVGASTVGWSGNPVPNHGMVILTAMGMNANTTGALPTGVTIGTTYFAANVSGNNFALCTADYVTACGVDGGALVVMSGSASGFTSAAYMLSSNSATYSAYTSGGLLQRQVPERNSALLTQADNYAAGGASIQTALNWMSNDIIQGTAPAGPGGSTPPANECAVGYYRTITYYATCVWPGFETINVSLGIKYDEYEGAQDTIPMNNQTAFILGINAAYPQKILNLLSGWKASPQLAAVMVTKYNMMRAAAPISGNYLSDSSDFEPGGTVFSTEQFGLFPSPQTLYTPPLASGKVWAQPFTSFTGEATVNASFH